MTTFPGSPRTLKGALVATEPPDPTLNVIVFQYNPVTLTRSLQGQTISEGEKVAGPVRLWGAPEETIELGEVEIDATDQLEKGDDSATRLGIHPQLAALEMLTENLVYDNDLVLLLENANNPIYLKQFA